MIIDINHNKAPNNEEQGYDVDIKSTRRWGCLSNKNPSLLYTLARLEVMSDGTLWQLPSTIPNPILASGFSIRRATTIPSMSTRH